MKKTVLFAALALLSVFVFAQERTAIAVFPFEDMDNLLTQNESVLFYRRFSNEFVNKNNGRFRVIPRQDVEKLINTEAKFQLSDFSAQTKTTEMQRVLNGSQILSGYIGKMGTKLSLSISLFTYPDLEQLPGGVDIDVANKDELFTKIPDLVQSMMTAITESGTKQASTLLPNSPQAYLERGKMFFDRNDYDIAILELTEAIKLDPNLAEAYAYRARAYNGKKNYDQGLSDANTAIRLDPQLALAYFARGYAYSGKEDYDRAITDFSQAIKLDPQFANAYLNRGNAYRNKEDYDRAITDYSQIIRLNPQDASAYLFRGLTYYYKKDYDRAISDYTEAIKINPQYSYAYNNRGVAYYYKKDYDRAIADYEAAIRFDPNYTTAKNNLENARKAKTGK